MEIRIDQTNRNRFCITFPFDVDVKNAVKALPGARFDGDRRLWTVPAVHVKTVLAFGLEYDAQIDPAVHALIESQAVAVAAASATTDAPTDAAPLDLPASIADALRPYQRAGVVYMLEHRRSMQADEMGLGKTLQALAACEAAGGYPALVLAPASLLRNWRNEIARWLPHRKVQVISKGKTAVDPDAEIVIVSYDVAKGHAGIQAAKWVTVIADEAHALKSSKSARSKALAPVVAGAKNRWLLSGTPLKNRPADLIEPLKMLGHLDALGGWRTYVTRYCAGRQGKYGWEIDGASNLNELRAHLAALGFVRRVKADVLSELPAKIRTVLPVELGAHAGRGIRDAETALRDIIAGKTRALSDVANDDAGGQRGDVLGALARLRRAVGVAKIEAANAWVDDALAQDEKLLVFGHHSDVLDGIENHLRDADVGYVRLDGSTPVQARQGLVDRFQTDEKVRVFLGSMSAAGQGITLTAASQVLITEQAWTPAEMDQAEDRAHRIGQKDTVMVTHLIAVNTIDEPVLDLISTKRATAAQAIDGATETQASESIERMLLARFGAKADADAPKQQEIAA
ncbi:DEAD/DEAH box helicase [Metallibacterium sp.]|uniref:DEAD/DEAH box helicase n=1 Tax=Metallibacterium sp. TaxID=2940281 RepID=UPI002630FE94|nr:DEAD/DEAH box helicase [Metallibacterium sp.]